MDFAGRKAHNPIDVLNAIHSARSATYDMTDLSIIDKTLSSIVATPATLSLLRDLHTQALAETPYSSTDSQPASTTLDKFVALDPDKCALVYLLLRSSGARYVVEAGTSFGLSTIYLALAVGQNAAIQRGEGKVIATENEKSKAERARRHWRAAGEEVERWIELREGDIRETLKMDLPEQIDFLLLDSRHLSNSILCRGLSLSVHDIDRQS